MRRKRAPIATTEKPLKESLIPSANILYRSHIDNLDAEKNEPDSARTTQSPRGNPGEGEEGKFSDWVTSPDLIRENLAFTPDVMYNLNNFLLGNPNMNSPLLFRADILYDSAGQLRTPREKERGVLHGKKSSGGEDNSGSEGSPYTEAEALHIPGFELKRTVVSELIPRKPKLDRSLKQTCLYYEGVSSCSLGRAGDVDVDAGAVQRALYLFLPDDVKTPQDVPFYYPHLRGWGFLYDYESDSTCSSSAQNEGSKTLQDPEGETASASGNGTLSLHILPFAPAEGFDPFPVRLERILQNLLSTHIRLARNTRPTTTMTTTTESQHNTSTTDKKHGDDSYNPDKDNIIPRHMVQNTYSRLKATYSHDLCTRWVENTEPSKHVFEDLAITAFLIELWRNMYGIIPRAEKAGQQQTEDENENCAQGFPGFVDIACGNGVLVYVLLMEGYQGWGFDARRRKTWSIFPQWVQQGKKLKEAIYIPEPFVEEFVSTKTTTMTADIQDIQQYETTMHHIRTHNGIHYTTGDFPKGTFIISNHADELTVWTPLLAALACPEDPLPFLSIPCCSHALSGARYRYRPPKNEKTKHNPDEKEDNPQTGDLKLLRAEKRAASTSLRDSDPDSAAVLNSMYGCLTAKTMSVAEEVGYDDVEKTLLRIPSTRNMGVIGGRRRGLVYKDVGSEQRHKLMDAEIIRRSIDEVVRRECAIDGGVRVAARIWVERALGLQKPSKRAT